MKSNAQRQTDRKPGKLLALLLALMLLFHPAVAGAYAAGEAPGDVRTEKSGEPKAGAGASSSWATLAAGPDAPEPEGERLGLSREEEPARSAFLKEGDLSAEELAEAVLSPEALPAFLSAAKAEERGHVRRLTEQQPGPDTAVFQNRNGSKTLYCPVESLSVSPGPEGEGAWDGAESAALEKAVRERFGLKTEQIGEVYTDGGMAVAEYSEIGGDFYINCYGSGEFLTCGNVRATTASGTVANLGNSAIFKIVYAGNGYHYIKLYADTSKYLQFAAEGYVCPLSYPSGQPGRALWQLEEDGSFYNIVNKQNGYSFYSGASFFCNMPQENEGPDGRKWRFLDKAAYQANELTGYTLSSYELNLRVDYSGKVLIQKTPSNAMLATADEFRVYCADDHLVDAASKGSAVFFTGLEIGTAEVKVTHAPTGKQYMVKIHVAPASGQYKLRNRAGAKYLSYALFVSPIYMPVLPTYEQADEYDYDLSLTITSASPIGYFYIRSSNGRYLTATSGESVVFMDKVTGADADAQLWFYSGEDGSGGRLYSKLNPERVLAADSSSIASLRTYTDDSEYSDEWIIFREGTTTLGMPGYFTGDPAMEGVSRSVNLALRKVPFIYPNIYRYIDRDLGLTAMREGPIVVFNTHGSFDKIKMTHTLAGDSGEYLTMQQVKALPAGAFDDTKMVIYIACNTATGGASADNLFKATVDKGAEIVIGFSGQIYDPECNYWMEAFFKKLSEKGTVLDAIREAEDKASEKAQSNSMQEFLVTSGNLSQFVYLYN